MTKIHRNENLTIRITLLVTIRGVNKVGGGIVADTGFQMQLRGEAERLPALRPLLGHLEEVRSPQVAVHRFLHL